MNESTPATKMTSAVTDVRGMHHAAALSRPTAIVAWLLAALNTN